MLRRVTVAILLILGLLGTMSHAQDDSLYQLFDQASSLRFQLRYEEAAHVYRQIIDGYPDQEDVVRKAWNELVFTYTQDEKLGPVDEVAREALAAHPDLTADTVSIPQAVNELYDELRAEMFGSLTILKPEECLVSLDGVLLGETPAMWPYVPVGEYTLTATKEKHHDYEERITVAPAGDHRLELSMSRRKDAMFWVTRVGGGALVAGTIYAIASSGSDEGGAQALADPPAPPSW